MAASTSVCMDLTATAGPHVKGDYPQEALIASKAESCLTSLTRCIDYAKAVDAQKEASIDDLGARFRIWTFDSNVLARLDLALDYRLEEAGVLELQDKYHLEAALERWSHVHETAFLNTAGLCYPNDRAADVATSRNRMVKSTMSMFLVEALSEDFAKVSNKMLAYFFCDSGYDTRKTATAVVRGLLLKQHPRLVDYVLPTALQQTDTMNIAQPVSSELGAVEFTFLTPKEIRAISAKRIENDATFNSLLNPVPGGLYDPALGSWGDEPCLTCNLVQSSCPGHPGHIELPAPVYHPVFMDQAYRLLRAACVYCSGFRLRPKDLHKYICKFRLLQHGLLHEAQIVEAIGEAQSAEMEENIATQDSEAEEDHSSADALIRKREKYVQSCLRGLKSKRGDTVRTKHEGRTQSRRDVIRQFLADITKTRQCASCGGISPSYRKDRFVKIFEKSLSPKEQAKMAQKNYVRKDAMDRVHLSKKRGLESESTDEAQARSIDYGEVLAVGTGASQRYISPLEVRARLTALFEKEQDIMCLLYDAKPRTRRSLNITPDMFFITTLLVPPNRYRPEARTGDSQIAEATQNSLYKAILQICARIARVHEDIQSQTASDMTQLHQVLTELQEGVNALIDKNKNPVQGAAAKRNEDGIKQLLEKKEGLFRKNMMGKRVNYAARSVISPDPNIETNEIGVPPVFARKLTYPEPVTNHNFRDLRQAVINGTDTWPGAIAIENEQGQVQSLRNKSVDERTALANQLLVPSNPSVAGTKSKKVHRHITNGDVVLMNRQPTLHKPSIMGHRVRVLPGEKTIRMHYANCNTYNADFDGDEMNMHFPQNEIARAEALQIADTDHQYLSGTQGKPLRGLIQDHISVSIFLCSRDAFFSRGDYHQLVYSAIRPESGHCFGERIHLLPPAIVKPVPRWTGKQIITTILRNMQPPNCGPLTLRGESQIKAEQWGSNSEEGTVLIHEGEFVTGILDKAQIGQSSGGLIHAIHEIHGPAVAGKLLTALGRLLTRYLNMRAFSCGMDDLRLTAQGEQARQHEIQAINSVGLEIASKYVSLEDTPDPGDPILLERLEEVLRDDSKQEGLDLLMNQRSKDITDAIQRACIPYGLEKPFPQNQMQAMTTSGAKGSRVNASLISCNLGQQVLESRRVPVMVSGKTLPCFRPFETNIAANGYIGSRFLTGIRPQEYFFHHMAGREGLIDTAVKTSRSGYLQRCVIKGLEGLMVAYDTTVRDADGSIVQFLYGGDGLDVTKQTYLKEFGFLLQNLTSELARLRYDPQVVKRLGANRDFFTKYMKSAVKHPKPHDPKSRDPLTSMFNPATNAFVLSEAFYNAMSTYLKDNADGLIRDKGSKAGTGTPQTLNRKNAEVLFAMKYLQSLAEPGEAVGIVAGQSVGEPSTQMTLNTFHLAGHAAKNVTAGIPRLREILMTASRDISTPAMSLYPNKDLSAAEAELFARSISALPLSYLMDSVTVEERVGQGKLYSMAKIYHIKLRLFSSLEYSETYHASKSEVMDAVEKKLLRQVVALSKAEIKKKAMQATAAAPDIGVKVGVVEMAPAVASDENNVDDMIDDDATNAKQRANRLEAVSYGPNDDADDAIQQAMDDATPADEWETSSQDDNEQSCEVATRNDSKEGHYTEVPQSAKSRQERALQAFAEVTEFEYDENSGEWCNVTLEFDSAVPKLLMLDIVQKAINKTLVRETRGIGACKLIQERTGAKEFVIHATGANIRAVQQYSDYIDPNRILTNDIAAILEVYGVEACRSNIVRELADVFGSHGIKVDNRHLSLIADYMTRNGGFTAFSRLGLQGNVSPFTKMSFETTLAFLKDAVLDGDWDELVTPSSRLVTGQLGKLGTGSFDLLTRLPTYHVDSLA
ncbi:DNA-directed RNA polymerase I subunit RPA1 [Purpureocillium lavendulum]|uniref:DNA-directed RNA polymerase subunit n=1 Tax=Purpureocillium lavendulum TaxID=1247861 RepID=A0AB34FJC0_9HYPO|nr:DNA-directed RNA polymerase I subunit RPA1 [Purpureocillium lavendulum]